MELQRARFWDFVRSFWGNWFSLMSGTPAVPAAIFALYVENNIARILFGVTAIGCLVFSAYLVWRVERKKVIELEAKLTPTMRLFINPDVNGVMAIPAMAIPAEPLGRRQGCLVLC